MDYKNKIHNRLKKTILKKEPGVHGIFDLFPVILLVVISAFIFMQTVFYMQYLNRINHLDTSAGKLLLSMTSTNGMTGDEKEYFLEEIKDLGIDETMVSFSGTTYENDDVHYLDPIYLMIRAKVPWVSMKLDSLGNHILKTSTKEYEIKKYALALS